MTFKRTKKTKVTGMISNFNIASAKTINYKDSVDEKTGEIIEQGNKSKRLIIPVDAIPDEMQKLIRKSSHNIIEVDVEDEGGQPTGEKYDAIIIKFSPEIYIAMPDGKGGEILTKEVWDNSKPNAELRNFQIGLTTPEITLDGGGKKQITRCKGIRFNDDSEFIEIEEKIFGISTSTAIGGVELLAIEE
nr:MAG TPA: hypothetical protein [Caudoviricetes sp.]